MGNWVGSGAYRLNYKAYEILNLKKNTNYRCTLPTLIIPAQFYPILTIHSPSTGTNSGDIIPAGMYSNGSNTDLNINGTVTMANTSDTSECIRGYVNSWDENCMAKLRRVLECNIQLEEGTVATPYEPYIEDKITILSPVQLEKVGDVRDRIIEKDGVWGVEKNVKRVVLNGSEDWTSPNTKGIDTIVFRNKRTDVNNYYYPVSKIMIISDKFKTINASDVWGE